MSVFDPRKLSINLIPPATSSKPLEGRKYTLTHSDITAQLFLDIGYVYNYKSINPKMRDEVLAEWKKDSHGRMNLIGSAYVDDGEFNQKVADIRFSVFKKEMSTAIKGMVYGDRTFYEHYPSLLDSPIFVHFLSSYPQYRKIAYYGTPRLYLNQIYISI
ncbi:staygreen family protein [Paenibacillus sp. sgz5001063]|uniref:staygreen family protein n=1 Tax=Paenibacillus sp. sgz5001063 TaxID=3242474 RepID=UPI0036D20FF9